MKSIVILGGGTGGVITANILGRKAPKGEVKITLINRTSEHIYQPGFLYLALGKIKDRAEIVKDLRGLLHKRVDLIVDEATLINTSENSVYLASGKIIKYDYLVIATGARLVPEEIPGHEASYHFYDFESAVKLRSALEKFEGGVIAVGVGGIPYKCPPAPAEFSCLLDYYFHERGLRDKVEIHYLSPLPRTFPHEAVADVIQKALEDKGIQWHPMFNIESIDPERKIVYSLEGESLKFDMLVMVPPHRGAEVIEKSGLGDEGGWIKTDKYTLKVKGYDNIYAIGDATDLPVSKSGAAAHYEAKVVAERILAELKGKNSDIVYNGKVRCFCDAGFGKAITMSFDYDHPPKKPKMSRIWYLAKLMVNKFYWSLILKGWV